MFVSLLGGFCLLFTFRRVCSRLLDDYKINRFRPLFLVKSADLQRKHGDCCTFSSEKRGSSMKTRGSLHFF